MIEEKKYSVEKIRRYFKGKYSWTSIDKLIKKMYLDGEINWEKTKGLSETDARKVIERIGKLEPVKREYINNGYKYIKIPDDSYSKPKCGYIAEHRYVVEQFLERNLDDEEVVIHMNGDKIDNNWRNLCLCKNLNEARKIKKSFMDLLPRLLAIGVVGFNGEIRKFELLDRDK